MRHAAVVCLLLCILDSSYIFNKRRNITVASFKALGCFQRGGGGGVLHFLLSALSSESCRLNPLLLLCSETLPPGPKNDLF